MWVCGKCWDSSSETLGGYGNCRVSYKALHGTWEAAKAQPLERSELVSRNQYLLRKQECPRDTCGYSKTVKQHTWQILCSGISSVLHHQMSEWSVLKKRKILFFHSFEYQPDATGWSSTDLTGASGCSGGKRLHYMRERHGITES